MTEAPVTRAIIFMTDTFVILVVIFVGNWYLSVNSLTATSTENFPVLQNDGTIAKKVDHYIKKEVLR